MILAAFVAAFAAAAPAAEPFVPPTTYERGRAVLPIVFTDGTRAELVYPPRLRIAELGVEPYSSGFLAGATGREFVARHQPVDDVTAGWTLFDRVHGLGFWDSGPGPDDANFLVFEFGRWTVPLYDHPPGSGNAPMTARRRAGWARMLRGRETARGYLRLWGRGRLRLAQAGERGGPQLWFGSPSPTRRVELTPGRCKPPRERVRRIGGKRVDWGKAAVWCLSRTMRVIALGPPRFRRALIRSLAVR